jgi:hypothetical protein
MVDVENLCKVPGHAEVVNVETLTWPEGLLSQDVLSWLGTTPGESPVGGSPTPADLVEMPLSAIARRSIIDGQGFDELLRRRATVALAEALNRLASEGLLRGFLAPLSVVRQPVMGLSISEVVFVIPMVSATALERAQTLAGPGLVGDIGATKTLFQVKTFCQVQHGQPVA